jgi:hypothetical protein
MHYILVFNMYFCGQEGKRTACVRHPGARAPL